MKNAILFLFVILTFTSCQKSKVTSIIVGKDWLLGKWENKSDEGNLLETWTKLNDSVFNGTTYFIKGKDTLHFEKMELTQKGEELVYISTTKGQNNDKPISLLQNPEIEKQLVFENPKLDYPRKIIYKRMATNRLFIEVSGIEQDKPSSIRYSLKKTK